MHSNHLAWLLRPSPLLNDYFRLGAQQCELPTSKEPVVITGIMCGILSKSKIPCDFIHFVVVVVQTSCLETEKQGVLTQVMEGNVRLGRLEEKVKVRRLNKMITYVLYNTNSVTFDNYFKNTLSKDLLHLLFHGSVDFYSNMLGKCVLKY